MRTGNTIGARVIGLAAALGSLLLTLAVGGGCQNRMADERDKLWQQNREQQAVIDELKNRPPTERIIVQQVPMTQPAATPAPAPTPAPAVTETPPAPAPTEIGGFTVDEDRGAGTLTVNLPGDVLFDSGQATLKPAVRASLDKVVAALKGDYDGKQVRVEGHTDADPIRRSKWKSNQELSEARAKAVRDYLVSKGIESNRLSTQGFGPDRPKGENKQQNRRVEIVVVTNAAAGGGAQQNLNK